MATTLPPMTLDPELMAQLERVTARRAALDAQWRDLIRKAEAEGGSLREIAAVAGISHTAVKFIAHGRPEK